MILCEFDKAGAEWVVVAYLSGDARMIEICEKGLDPHIETGHLISGVPHDLIKHEKEAIGNRTEPQEIEELRRRLLPELYHGNWFLPRIFSIRQMGKKSNHALNYDEGYRVFALTNEMDESESKRIVEAYRTKAYPNIPVWHRAIQDELRTNDRTLHNLFGHKVRLMGEWGHELFKKGYAYKPQSTVTHIINASVVRTYNDPSLAAFEFLAQTHDSACYQHPVPRTATEWNVFASGLRRVGLEYANPVLQARGRKFKIRTDLKVGKKWGEAMIPVKLEQPPKALVDEIRQKWSVASAAAS